jgi:serine/threonine-protein kinase
LLVERIAIGGMAEVYRAVSSGASGFEKQLAVKRIHPHSVNEAEFRQLFEREAKLSSHLNHANIVHVYDFQKIGDEYLLAMEFVEGKSFRQLLDRGGVDGKLPIELCVYLISEVCKGLHYAHDLTDTFTRRPLDIIHRDISPQNLMISYQGEVKIVDFGIAKAVDAADLTRLGAIRGKLRYMSPEQVSARPLNRATDLFSTGVVLFELLTGKRPFDGENEAATMKRIEECRPPFLSRLNPKVGAELEALVLKALAREPGDRYPDAGELHRALKQFLAKHHPGYTQRDVAKFVQKTFERERELEARAAPHESPPTVALERPMPTLSGPPTTTFTSQVRKMREHGRRKFSFRAEVIPFFAFLAVVSLSYWGYKAGTAIREIGSLPSASSRPAKPPATGKLELVLSVNAKIFESEEFLVEAKAGEPFQLLLTAGTHELRFVNEDKRIDVKRSFPVPENEVLGVKVELE